MSTPRQRMCPWRERRKPMSARSRVVLPAPFRPMITTRSAAPTRSETPFSTGTCPYRAWRPSTSSTRPLPQVDVADDVVRSDLVHGPFGKHGASVEHGDVSRDVSHEVHVVLDHDQRRPPVDLAYEVGRASRLGMGHAGGGLVEENQGGGGRPDHADFHPLPIAVREVPHRAGPALDEADLGQDPGDDRAGAGGPMAGPRREAEGLRPPRAPSDPPRPG